MIARCRLCHSSSISLLAVPEAMWGTGEVFGYASCASCDALQIAEYPSDGDNLYSTDYYSHHVGSAERISTRLRRRVTQTRDQHITAGKKSFFGMALSALFPNQGLGATFKALAPHLVGRSSILDVGCGASGRFLALASNFGLTSLHGIDPYLPEEKLSLGNVSLVKSELCDVQNEYDVVIFNHSLEHMRDQIGTLREASRVTKDGGVCILRIPVVGGLAWELYGVNWVQLDAPRHLYLHSLKSIRSLAAEVGFTEIDLSWDSYGFQFWGSQQAASGIALESRDSLLHRRGLGAMLEKRRCEKRAMQANAEGRGDQIILTLTKTACGL